ncbi:MAG: TrkH family potassium uptake protein [Gammaproteobacteria bacterium]|nr:TrkH family potassium uptake protein [Gammaproteobacteria bacterium]MDH5777098.1 TrkH family potassium uptake protein [Gammaproteobacteria bacterium]
MQVFAVQRVLGLFLMVFSTSLIPPMLVSLYYQDQALAPFVKAFTLTIMVGFILWAPVNRYRKEFRMRDGFVIVAMFWTVLGLVGALPLYLNEHIHMSFTNAVFESLSGLTTTGATVITQLADLPKSILYYRQQLQWLGGIGIIVIAVAIMPMLGIGGMQLYRAETPGPMKDSKLTPRITETAKALWYIYLSLTVACALAYWAAGMTLFDAIGHSFSTIAIGGFSTHDESMGYFNDMPQVEVVAIVFMLLAGVNFALHFTAWRDRNPLHYFRDVEFKTYLGILFTVGAISSAYLYYKDVIIFPEDAILSGVFQAVSIGTTTGFTTAEYHNWPGFLPVLLLFTSFIGACAGSTGGGMKVIRFLLLLKQGMREIKRVIHPRAIIPIKVGDTALPDRVIEAVWGFFATYVAIFVVIMLILMLTGLDQISAFSATAACINNLGPGLNEVGSNYASLTDVAKWVLAFAMLLGRLEIFTLLVLLSPAFWRR